MTLAFLACQHILKKIGKLFQSSHPDCLGAKLHQPKQMGVSKNNGTPKSSILIGCSIINHPFWGVLHPYFWFNTQIEKRLLSTPRQKIFVKFSVIFYPPGACHLLGKKIGRDFSRVKQRSGFATLEGQPPTVEAISCLHPQKPTCPLKRDGHPRAGLETQKTGMKQPKGSLIPFHSRKTCQLRIRKFPIEQIWSNFPIIPKTE